MQNFFKVKKLLSGRASIFLKSAICSIIIIAEGEHIVFFLQVLRMENEPIEKMHFEDREINYNETFIKHTRCLLVLM